jgi:PEP-CTERM motif
MLGAANYGGSDLALVAVNGNQGLVTADPVPEPMSIALLGIGMLGLGWVRRKTIT